MVLIFSIIVESNAEIKEIGYIKSGDKMNKSIIYKMFRETIDDVTEVKIRVYKRLLEH